MSRNSYFDHDDRDRVPSQRGPVGRHRKFGYTRVNPRGGSRARYHDADGDVDMNAPGSSWNTERKLHPYRNPKHGKDRRRRGNNNKLIKNYGRGSSNFQNLPDSPWYRVVIPYGKKIGKQFIVKSLVSFCQLPIIPFNYQIEGTAAMFFVNRLDTAIEIRNANKVVTAPDGIKMAVIVSPCMTPGGVVDNETQMKIKEFMSRMYDTATHSLNLSRLEENPLLREHCLYLQPCRTNVLHVIVKIIKENIPEIEVLDLSSNNLSNLVPLKNLIPVCKELKALSLKDNRLRTIQELHNLKGLELRSLVLDGNNLCDSFKEPAVYVSAIRDIFPKLLQLDGHELPAPIGFDLGSEKVPASKGSFFMAEDVKGLVVQFLEQYYMIYDSENRDKLLEAYHENATFSLSIPKVVGPLRPSDKMLAAYVNENRNLLRINDAGRRNNLLRNNRIAILSTLSQLPITQHDPQSFIIDIFQVTPGLMAFSVNGVFKEIGPDMSNQPLRSFFRTFVVAPRGQGFVITNEMLFITNATKEQIKAFKFAAPTPSPSPASSVGDKSPNEKQQLAMEFMKFCGMNLEFTVKLLEEHDWDSQRSAAVFTELNNMGRIPPEAFIHK